VAWTTGTTSSVTYADGTTTSKTYSAGAVSTVAWGTVSPQPASADNGVDFEFQFRDSNPLLFSADRPLYFASSLSEGQP